MATKVSIVVNVSHAQRVLKTNNNYPQRFDTKLVFLVTGSLERSLVLLGFRKRNSSHMSKLTTKNIQVHSTSLV